MLFALLLLIALAGVTGGKRFLTIPTRRLVVLSPSGLHESASGSIASLLPLFPGTYRVYWRVVVKDIHLTMGDFTFTIK